MSYAAMYGVPAEGPFVVLHRYKNAMGTAPRIWNYLGESYYGFVHSIGEPELAVVFDSLATGLYRSHEDVCLNLTADRCIVRKADFQRVSQALYLMHDFSYKPDQVNHLATIAGHLMLAEHFEDYIGVAFMWTSVGDDVWNTPVGEQSIAEEDREEFVPDFRLWDISRDKGHRFLFEADLTEQVKEATEGPTLQNWEIRYSQYYGSAFVKPDNIVGHILHGNVYNHPRKDELPDSTFVHTSTVVSVPCTGCGKVQTCNTLYTLGEMSEGYAKWCKEQA